MQPGYVCVAGIDLVKKQHIRPTIGRRIEDTMAKRHGGVFAVGDVIDLGATSYAGTAPEIEDHQFVLDDVKYVQTMSSANFWKVLCEISRPSLEHIFGEQLEQKGNSYATLEGKGVASLGCLLPRNRPNLFINWGKVYLSLENNGVMVQVKVNDLRMHERDGTVNQVVVLTAAARINSGEKVILSVGLARAFQAMHDTQRRHWLQVNNIHFANDSTWTAL